MGRPKSTKQPNQSCAAMFCDSNPKSSPTLNFFSFPKDSDRCQIWVQNSRRVGLIGKGLENLHKTYVLCSKHFEPSQFVDPHQPDKLLGDAVPTLFALSRQANAESVRRTQRKTTVSNGNSIETEDAGAEEPEQLEEDLKESSAHVILQSPNAALLYDDPHETSSDRDGSADMRITEDDTSVVTPTQPEALLDMSVTDGDSVEIKLEPPDTGILDCEMSGSGFHSGLDTCPQPDPASVDEPWQDYHVGETGEGGKRKIKSYTIDFKLHAIQHWRSGHSKVATARHFGVDAKRIRDWIKQEEQLLWAVELPGNKRKRLEGGGRRPLNEVMEERLVCWIEEQRAEKRRVTRRAVRLKALELHESLGADETIFLASLGWMSKFFARHGITLVSKQKGARQERSEPQSAVVPQLASFFRSVQSTMKRFALQKNQVGAMDEILIWLNRPADTKADSSRTTPAVSMMFSDKEEVCVTVLLCAKADGSKLPPFVVFQGEGTEEEELKEESGVVCEMSATGYLTQELTLHWLQKVWSQSGPQNHLLIWDDFLYHCLDPVRQELEKQSTRTSVAPATFSQMVLPPDACWKKPFKEAVQQYYDDWLTIENSLQSQGFLKAPSKFVIASWVRQAWDSLNVDLIKNSFVECGITDLPDSAKGVHQDKQIRVEGTDLASRLRELRDSGQDLAQLDVTHFSMGSREQKSLVVEEDSDEDCI